MPVCAVKLCRPDVDSLVPREGAMDPTVVEVEIGTAGAEGVVGAAVIVVATDSTVVRAAPESVVGEVAVDLLVV